MSNTEPNGHDCPSCGAWVYGDGPDTERCTECRAWSAYLGIAAQMLDCQVAELPPELVKVLNNLDALIQKVPPPDATGKAGLRSRHLIAFVIDRWWDCWKRPSSPPPAGDAIVSTGEQQ